MQDSISARKDQFMSTKDLESSFDHCGAPVKLVEASLCTRKDVGSNFHRCGDARAPLFQCQ